MKLNDDLYILKLPMDIANMELNLSLIVDGDELVLVDTGVPGQEELIEAEIRKEGLDTATITRIILTHQDIDHVGSLNALVARTGAEAMALAEEIAYIDGSKPSPKMPPKEVLDANPAFAEMLRQLKRTPVDVALTDGQILDIAGGVRVVATPGHTPGHMSLYLERSKVLITGDALVSDSGQLHPPMARATPDMPTAMESVRRLAQLDVEAIVCYHGGLVTENPNAQLRRVSETQL
jgi:glyoxylase-like metal-dependent hydrolase (beta-lactamase superfamily II)